MDLSKLELNEAELEKELKSYFNRGFKWRQIKSCQIWTPHFFVEDSDLIKYFEDIKLEFGNKEQIEMLEALNLMRVVDSTDNYGYWNSDYFASDRF